MATKKAAKKKTARKATSTKKASASKKTSSTKKAPAKKASASKKAPAKKASSTKKASASKNAAKKASSTKKAPARKASASKKTATAAAASTKSSGTATLVQHVFVPATPLQVYAMLTDPKLHGELTGDTATGAPVVGGAYSAWSGYIRGEYLELQPGALIVSSWTTTEWPRGAPPSRLEIQLVAVDDGTELVMTHSEVPSSQADDYRQGWIDFYWNPLRAHFGAAS